MLEHNPLLGALPDVILQATIDQDQPPKKKAKVEKEKRTKLKMGKRNPIAGMLADAQKAGDDVSELLRKARITVVIRWCLRVPSVTSR
jgi:hypothetical protein